MNKYPWKKVGFWPKMGQKWAKMGKMANFKALEIASYPQRCVLKMWKT